MPAATDEQPISDETRCLCGHRFDEHNDITRRCCFRVRVGLDLDGLPYPDPNEAPDPISRNCDLCPPSGFTTEGYIDNLYGKMWPRSDWITGYSERENWLAVP